MGMFSKSTEYAMRAVFYIAKKSYVGEKVNLKDIAAQIQSPEAFLGKILQNLSRNGLIKSHKGPNGGFYLTEDEMKKSLLEVVQAMEGNSVFVGCGMGLSQCSEKQPCPLHHKFKVIRNELRNMLSSTTLAEFNEELLDGRYRLNRKC